MRFAPGWSNRDGWGSRSISMARSGVALETSVAGVGLTGYTVTRLTWFALRNCDWWELSPQRQPISIRSWRTPPEQDLKASVYNLVAPHLIPILTMRPGTSSPRLSLVSGFRCTRVAACADLATHTADIQCPAEGAVNGACGVYASVSFGSGMRRTSTCPMGRSPV